MDLQPGESAEIFIPITGEAAARVAAGASLSTRPLAEVKVGPRRYRASSELLIDGEPYGIVSAEYDVPELRLKLRWGPTICACLSGTATGMIVNLARLHFGWPGGMVPVTAMLVTILVGTRVNMFRVTEGGSHDRVSGSQRK